MTVTAGTMELVSFFTNKSFPTHYVMTLILCTAITLMSFNLVQIQAPVLTTGEYSSLGRFPNSGNGALLSDCFFGSEGSNLFARGLVNWF